jgi:hypothetical protein
MLLMYPNTGTMSTIFGAGIKKNNIPQTSDIGEGWIP